MNGVRTKVRNHVKLSISRSQLFPRRVGVILCAVVTAVSGLVVVVGVQALHPPLAGATGSPIPTISNLPSSGNIGGLFSPTVSTTSGGTTSVTSSTPSVCSVNLSGSVSYLAAGTCSLVSHVATFQSTFVAGFRYPQGVAVDASGNVYVADLNNNRVEEVTPAADGATQSFVIRPTTPAAPTAINAVAANQSVVVSWTNSASNGDPAVYNKVDYSTNGTTWTAASSKISASATSYTVMRLTNGTPYYFRVLAIDGSGHTSAVVTTLTTVTPRP